MKSVDITTSQTKDSYSKILFFTHIFQKTLVRLVDHAMWQQMGFNLHKYAGWCVLII